MPISAAKHRANEKYNAKAYDTILVRVQKGQKEYIQSAAAALGETVNGFVKKAIEERIERNGFSLSQPPIAAQPVTDEQ